MSIFEFKAEIIIYLYLAGCVAVLIFNIAYIFGKELQKKHSQKESRDMVALIMRQIALVEKREDVEALHIKKLQKNLRHLDALSSFEISMEAVRRNVPEEYYRQYLKRIQSVFFEIAPTYEKRDAIEQAYFARLAEKFEIDKGHAVIDGFMEILIQFVIGKDIYARENALRALFSIGNIDAVYRAWEEMQTNQIHHNAKLLADGLLKFSGDRLKLAHKLFARYRDFDVHLVLPVMQFIRFFSADFQKEILILLQDEKEEKELHLEALRYFMSYPYEPAREYLYQILLYQSLIDWEYAAMAAKTLSAYPGEETVRHLKDGLRSKHWHVRLNCAQSLIVGLNIPQLELFDIYNGNDRYAREILQYATEKAGIETHKMEMGEESV